MHTYLVTNYISTHRNKNKGMVFCKRSDRCADVRQSRSATSQIWQYHFFDIGFALADEDLV
jgi:hypothetical protein